MFGPSWWIGKGVKTSLQALGVDPATASLVARGLHITSSCFMHDHHTHVIPYDVDFGSDVSDIDFDTDATDLYDDNDWTESNNYYDYSTEQPNDYYDHVQNHGHSIHDMSAYSHHSNYDNHDLSYLQRDGCSHTTQQEFEWNHTKDDTTQWTHNGVDYDVKYTGHWDSTRHQPEMKFTGKSSNGVGPAWLDNKHYVNPADLKFS